MVLDGKVTSNYSLVRIRSHAFSTGIAANNETTPKEIITSSSSEVMLAISL